MFKEILITLFPFLIVCARFALYISYCLSIYFFVHFSACLKNMEPKIVALMKYYKDDVFIELNT